MMMMFAMINVLSFDSTLYILDIRHALVANIFSWSEIHLFNSLNKVFCRAKLILMGPNLSFAFFSGSHF